MQTFDVTLNQREMSAAVYKGQEEAFPGTSLPTFVILPAAATP